MNYDSNYMSKISYNKSRLNLHEEEEDFLQWAMTQITWGRFLTRSHDSKLCTGDLLHLNKS